MDIYFASQCVKELNSYFEENNLNLLYSQYNDRAYINKYSNMIKEGSFKGKLMIDSGAFSVFKSGAEIDVDDYISYLNELDGNYTVAIQLDKIPGKFGEAKTVADINEASKQSIVNFNYMVSKLKHFKKLMPVFHQHESFDVLNYYLNYRFSDGSKIEYIGLAPAKDTGVPLRENFLAKCYNVIFKSSNKEIKTHLLGVFSLPSLMMFPCTSADATSWKLSAGYGSIITEFGIINISSAQKDRKGNFNTLPMSQKEIIINRTRKYDISIDDLINDTKARYLFNVKYMVEATSKIANANVSSYKTQNTLFEV